MTVMGSLLSISVRSKRDVLAARQRARQLARLLRFEPREQLCIAAGTFAIAAQALRWYGSATLYFEISADTLLVTRRLGRRRPRSRKNSIPTAYDGQIERLVKPLPGSGAAFAPEDLIWIAAQLTQRTPLDVFEEMESQNHEMLALLRELAPTNAQAAGHQGKQLSAFAA
jgi:hypothetical protein